MQNRKNETRKLNHKSSAWKKFVKMASLTAGILLSVLLICACAKTENPAQSAASGSRENVTAEAESAAAKAGSAPAAAEQNLTSEFGDVANDGKELSLQEGRTQKEGIIQSIKTAFRRTILENDRWKEILMGIVTTLEVLAITLVTGFLFGVGVYLLYYGEHPILSGFIDKLMEFMLLMPLSTWLLVVYYVFFGSNQTGSILVAIIALTVSYGVTVFDCIKDAVESIDPGQLEAAVSMGYSRYQILFKIIMPQALPGFWLSLRNDTIGHVRGTSLVGMVAVMDIQAVADQISADTLEPLFPLLITVIVYTGLASLLNTALKKISIRQDTTRRTEEEIRKRIAEGKF